MDYEVIEEPETTEIATVAEENPNVDWKQAGMDIAGIVGGAVVTGFLVDMAWVAYEDSFVEANGVDGVLPAEKQLELLKTQRLVGAVEIVGAVGIQIGKLYMMKKSDQSGFICRILDGASAGLAVAGVGNVLEAHDAIGEIEG